MAKDFNSRVSANKMKRIMLLPGCKMFWILGYESNRNREPTGLSNSSDKRKGLAEYLRVVSGL